MELPIGKNTVVITSNTVTEMSGKEVVRLFCESRELAADPINVLIWLTKKAEGIARAQLKVCGFDIDKEKLKTLVSDPERLKGKMIPVLVEEWNGRLQASIVTNTTPSDSRLDEIEAGLRTVKKSGETPVVKEEEEDLPF